MLSQIRSHAASVSREEAALAAAEEASTHIAHCFHGHEKLSVLTVIP